MGSALVGRLDIARDFRVTNPQRILNGLVLLPRSWARSIVVRFSASTGHIETIRSGGDSSHVQLYDKRAESPGKVHAPRLRWEARIRRKWLLRYGAITTLADVTEASVAGLASDRWCWSRMGAAVSNMDTIADRVQRLGLSPTKASTLIGYLVQRGMGETPPFAATTGRAYERLADQIGAVDALRFHGGPAGSSTIRLDWAAGVEVADA